MRYRYTVELTVDELDFLPRRRSTCVQRSGKLLKNTPQAK